MWRERRLPGRTLAIVTADRGKTGRLIRRWVSRVVLMRVARKFTPKTGFPPARRSYAGNEHREKRRFRISFDKKANRETELRERRARGWEGCDNFIAV